VSIFNAAGIYLILDVNSPFPNGSLDRTAPWESYNPVYMKRVFGMIEAFKNYPNTLAFFAGNEVINEQSTRLVPAYIRVCFLSPALLGRPADRSRRFNAT